MGTTSVMNEAQRDRAVRFRELHAGAEPLRIANAWDATSARVMVAAGAQAVGTTSFGIALDHGAWDGEQLAFDHVLDVARGIVGAVDVPVSVDLEAGRGASAGDVRDAVKEVLACGAVGINIEDAVPGLGALRDATEQAERIAAARDAADSVDVPLFVNARCDVWFGVDVAPEDRVDEALRRAALYESAGADGLFLPGLVDPAVLATLTARTGLPVNVMIGAAAPPVAELVAAGVRRLSQGGEPFLATVGALKLLVEEYLTGEPSPPFEALGAGMSILPNLVAAPTSGGD